MSFPFHVVFLPRPLEASFPTLILCRLIRFWKSYDGRWIPVSEGLPMNLCILKCYPIPGETSPRPPMNLGILGGLLLPGRMRPGLLAYLWILNCLPLPERMPRLLMYF